MLKSIQAELRVLLTGTPLQNNITELFMLMHFLDATKFDDPEAFEAQFADISQDEQVLSSTSLAVLGLQAPADAVMCEGDQAAKLSQPGIPEMPDVCDMWIVLLISGAACRPMPAVQVAKLHAMPEAGQLLHPKTRQEIASVPASLAD